MPSAATALALRPAVARRAPGAIPSLGALASLPVGSLIVPGILLGIGWLLLRRESDARGVTVEYGYGEGDSGVVPPCEREIRGQVVSRKPRKSKRGRR